MAEIHGTASWPGAIGIESCSGTVSQGTSPGVFTLVIHPQDTFPATHGTLEISDSFNEPVVLPGCRLDNVRSEKDDSGERWICTIVDRRWRWRDLGLIRGSYNQLDPHGKLIPWTIKSPTELAELCLLAMGEDRYDLNLPPGLPSSIGQGQTAFLPTGTVFPPTGTNPPVDWYATPPAQALQQVAELFGCRVVYRVNDDSILVTPNGRGDFLPDGSIHKQGPAVKSPETPDAVGVIGAPTRYQVRLRLEPVGIDYDGTYRPIDRLSYAPLLPGKPGTPGQPQISLAVVSYDGTTAGVHYQIFLAAPEGSEPDQGVLFEYVAVPPLDTDATIAQTLASLINASTNPAIKGVLTASAAGNTVTITGTANGKAFAFLAQLSGGTFPAGNSLEGNTTQLAAADTKGEPPQVGWAYCPPPLFPSVRATAGLPGLGVQATDRLTLQQALDLARRSVWKCYRVINVGASGDGPIHVPGYGPIKRRQQLVISDTQVDQVTPHPGDEDLRSPDGEAFNFDLYNGYSRDRRAVVYGSAAIENFNAMGVFHKDVVHNTPPGTKLPFTFSVDPVQQVITLGEHVYFFEDNQYQDPDLTLQCAVSVRNADTNQLEAYARIVALPGQGGLTNPKVEYHPDVQLNITSNYDSDNHLLAVSLLEDDAIRRADYYLSGLAAKYRESNAQTLTYNGIIPIDCDGAISQVSWSVGPGGAETVASYNTEHDPWVAPYPARRRAELLGAVERRQNYYDRVPVTFSLFGISIGGGG
jgi:hypothetical protein